MTRFSTAKGVLDFMETRGNFMLVQVNPSFALLCFHNTTHSCMRANDNGDLILNTNMQVAW